MLIKKKNINAFLSSVAHFANVVDIETCATRKRNDNVQLIEKLFNGN
jgi:phosphotransferase system IIB component